jgi:hypothetical protein
MQRYSGKKAKKMRRGRSRPVLVGVVKIDHGIEDPEIHGSCHVFGSNDWELKERHYTRYCGLSQVEAQNDLPTSEGLHRDLISTFRETESRYPSPFPFLFFGLAASSLMSPMLFTLASRLIRGPSKLLFELNMKLAFTADGVEEAG